MKPQHVLMLAIVLLLALFSLAGLALAQLNGYNLNWWTVDNGGGASGNGTYTLNGTIGQPDAGTLASGGGYTLAGGFWHGGAVTKVEMKVYLPLMVK
jgi:hypothetical protein